MFLELGNAFAPPGAFSQLSALASAFLALPVTSRYASDLVSPLATISANFSGLEFSENRHHFTAIYRLGLLALRGYQTPSEYVRRKTNRLVGDCAPPNPAPLAVAGVRGGTRINVTRWQTNENQNTKESAELQLSSVSSTGHASNTPALC